MEVLENVQKSRVRVLKFYRTNISSGYGYEGPHNSQKLDTPYNSVQSVVVALQEEYIQDGGVAIDGGGVYSFHA